MPYSYKSGFAPRDFPPRYPGLWKDIAFAYLPSLSSTGTMVIDQGKSRSNADTFAGNADGVWANDGSSQGWALTSQANTYFMAPDTALAGAFRTDPITFAFWFRGSST